MNTLSLADLLSGGGWLHIGPPYIYIDINPIIVQLGPLAVRWYGLMYVVGIMIGLWVIKGYTTRKGIDQDIVYRVLWWCIIAGLIGGRLYFVVQQSDFVNGYLLQPQRILATWEGGMAFYGAIFLVLPTLFWRAKAERINPLVLIDTGVLLAAAGQIFGRIGNLINGDIIGYPSTLPWSTVYVNPNSWACQLQTCNVPVQPAAGYELIINLIVLSVMLYLSFRVRRPGILMLVYLFSYTISQFLIFFTRANDFVNLLGINHVLKQAQWTSLVVFILLLPLTYWVLRASKPVPVGEVAATYGIPQPPKAEHELETKVLTENSHTTPAAEEDTPNVNQQASNESDEALNDEPPTTSEDAETSQKI